MIGKLLQKFKFLGFPPKEKCLVRKVTIDSIYSDMVDAQKWLTPDIASDEQETKKYLTSLSNWNYFLSSYKSNDELWYYRFPENYWKKLRGSHGYIILREGKYCEYFELVKN